MHIHMDIDSTMVLRKFMGEVYTKSNRPRIDTDLYAEIN